MTKRYLFANWKMNLTEDESVDLAKKFSEASKSLKNTTVGVAPATLNVSATKKAVGSNLVHKNKAARLKSRLTKMKNELKEEVANTTFFFT